MDLENVILKAGQHPQGDDGCAMEWVSVLAGEPWSDHPQCTCPVIAAFVRRWNDGISNDDDRTQLLKPLLPLLVNTRGDNDMMLRRMWLIIDWDIRTRTPAFLRLVPSLVQHADAIAALDEINSQKKLDDATEILKAVETAAGCAPWPAIAAASWAARATAKDAAWSAAQLADRVVIAAGTSAWAAIGAAVGGAVGAAAEGGDVVNLVLTVSILQFSAQDLIRRMCEPVARPQTH